MGYSEETPNYALPLYVADDKPSYLGDWNEAMNKTDAGMIQNKQGIADNAVKISNMQTYVDQSVSDSKTYVDTQIAESKTYVDTQIADAKTYVDGEVDALSAQVAKLRPVNVLVLGDSFSDPVYYDWAPTYERLTGAKVYNYAKSGAGFYVGDNFSAQASRAVAAIPVTIDTVIVYGGHNDFTGKANDTNVAAAMRTMISTLTNKWKDCQIYIVGQNAGLDRIQPMEWYYIEIQQKVCMGYNNVKYIEGSWYWLYNDTSLTVADRLHPSTAGLQLIAKNMFEITVNGIIPKWTGGVGYSPTTGYQSIYVAMNVVDNIVHVTMSGDLDLTAGTNYPIGTITQNTRAYQGGEITYNVESATGIVGFLRFKGDGSVVLHSNVTQNGVLCWVRSSHMW